MKDKHIVSTTTLAASLIMYFYSKGIQKDAVPLVMISGFVGALIGESIVEFRNKNKKD